MTPEANQVQDRVVKCLYCAQLIPLSQKLASLYVVAKDEAERAAQERKSRVLLLRCPKCAREAPYRHSEVMNANPVIAPNEVAGAQTHEKALRQAAS